MGGGGGGGGIVVAATLQRKEENELEKGKALGFQLFLLVRT
jgi:hypothetical protein